MNEEESDIDKWEEKAQLLDKERSRHESTERLMNCLYIRSINEEGKVLKEIDIDDTIREKVDWYNFYRYFSWLTGHGFLVRKRRKYGDKTGIYRVTPKMAYYLQSRANTFTTKIGETLDFREEIKNRIEVKK